MSLLCEKTLGGRVFVHDKDVAETLTKMEENQLEMSSMGPSSKGTPKSHPTSGKSVSWTDPRSIPNSRTVSVSELESRRMPLGPQGVLAQRQLADSQASLGYLLERRELGQMRKKELLHKTWNERVYEPIRQRVLNSRNSDRWQERDYRRRDLYRQYLEHVNKKGHVFLETMDEGEYYAQSMNASAPLQMTIYTPELKDPLLNQERARKKEDQDILRCMTGQTYSHRDIEQVKLPPLPLVPLGRHGTDSVTWIEMPFSNIESTPRKASRSRMKGNITQAQIDFEAWAKAPYDARVAEEEMQLQHKRKFEEKPPYGIPARPFEKAPFSKQTTSADIGMIPVTT